ncbi:hypothetical protein CSB07_00105 [Candidatus Gracilibacteria bacterium]|nr:MAG: hypothetical protein CSB07_00105 [Candidatus Gracilibacteria bacterium]PIE85679.1 MAG: hypothetical protein CSA08_00850 [Candidatus Gracilibacteria bacterium]
MINFKLVNKNKLTQNIFHLVFEIHENIKMIPGQFITFILPNNIGGRAYSILNQKENTIELIIKRVENGRGGSKFICDTKVGENLKGIGPAGNFVLRNNNNNKMFIGTGTGIAPLYNQIKYCLENNSGVKIKLVFGVRYKKDLFLVETLKKWKSENTNFDFEIYLSKEKFKEYKKGYVTNHISKENIFAYKEFYVCGVPQMVDDVVKKLTQNNINPNFIFTEKY